MRGGSNREFRRFLETARSSLKEVEVIFDLAGDGGLIPQEALRALRTQLDETARTLYGLLRSINERLEKGEVDGLRRPGTKPREPGPPPAV